MTAKRASKKRAQASAGKAERPVQGKDSWVTFRPAIKVMDCTIRDGGLMNSHKFQPKFVKAVYDACVEAGIDYMELGYKGSKKIFSPTEHGPWKYCSESDVRRVVGENKTDLKLSVMADAERTDYKTDILPRKRSVIDMVRVATYIHQVPTAVDMIKDAHDKGYETCVNLMAVSVVKERDLDDALEVFARSPVGTIVLVDSFGSLYFEQIRDLAKKYLKVAKSAGKQVGIHAHNNQQLAYANTIEALVMGVNRLDATIMGFGRGAGNCPLELLLGFLRNPRYHLRPILQCAQDVLLPLSKKVEWGFTIPYMITGLMNQHPRAAIKMRESERPDDYVKFLDSVEEGAF